MSRRKRHPQKGIEGGQIEWLKHRTGYPTGEEREKILQLRRRITLEVITLVLSRADRDDSRFRALIDKYGKEEVVRAERVFREGPDMPSLVADDARSNRDYRLRYSRFGAGLPFLPARQREDLMEKYAQKVRTETDDGDSNGLAEAQEVERLLLMDWRNWEDITRPAVPPRPDDYSAPQPASYPPLIAELLEWGNDLHKHHEFADERERSHWKTFIPALTRMALDPGLLNGWPGDRASWAPWHAFHTLGNLQAWESAPALAELAELEEDWLSDHLPHIWADMGSGAEPILWMMLDERSAAAKHRGLVAESLYMMTDDNEVFHNKVVKGFEKILRNDQTFDVTLNGYLISFLRSMGALDQASLAIRDAFDHDRVDLDLISPEVLEEDDFEHGAELD